MATYLYPEARELRAIGPALAFDMTRDDVLFSILPMTTSNATMLQWSVDADDYGLQQLRGLDGAPVHVTPIGKTDYVAEPGYFGEYMTITERELTLRGGSVVGESTVDISDLVAQKNRQLMGRQINRIRQIGWTLLTTGTFSITGKGSTLTYTDTFSIQTDSGSDWSTASSATPLSDMRDVQALGSEVGVDFGAAAVAIMNRVTANRMFSNTNAADLGGRRTTGGGTVTSLGETNRINMAEDLPTVVIYDKGYKNDSGTFTKFVPDDKVVYVGRRFDGDRIGEFRMTRNMVNPNGAPGAYEFIKDYAQGINAPKEVPPRIDIHSGFNGGYVLTRPSAIVVQSV